MAKNRQPIAKRCKALGISPAVMGYSKKTTIRNPGNGMRRKQSEYATQLKEKQKLKFIYGVLEHQFASYFDMAERQAWHDRAKTCFVCWSVVSITSCSVSALLPPAATHASLSTTVTSP